MTLAADCLDRLQLREQPFETALRESFLYKDTLLDTQIDRFLAALAQPGSMLLLCGHPGAGRSTQLMRLIGALPSQFETIAFRARSNTSFLSVDATIRRHLRARKADHQDQPLADILVARGRAGIDTLIAIDDAFLLSDDILRQITQLGGQISATNPRPPRIVLVADPELERDYPRILTLQDQRPIQTLGLAAFNQEQTAAYLLHRLTAAGNANLADVFRPDTIRTLQQRSHGLPGQLNALCEDWLTQVCDSPSAATQPSAPESEAPAAAAPQPTEELTTESESDHQDHPPDEPSEQSEEVSSDTAQPEDQAEAESKPDRANRRRKPWMIPAVTGLLLIAVVVGIAITLPKSEDPSSDIARLTQPSQPDEDVDNPDPAQAPSAPGNDEIAAPENETEQVAVIIESEATAANATTDDSASVAARRARHKLDIAWLEQQDAGQFTIQLIALKQIAAVERYLEKHGIQDAHVIPTRSLVIAVYGSFPDMPSAMAELPQLPPGVLAQGYWIRTIGKVRSDITP